MSTTGTWENHREQGRGATGASQKDDDHDDQDKDGYCPKDDPSFQEENDDGFNHKQKDDGQIFVSRSVVSRENDRFSCFCCGLVLPDPSKTIFGIAKT
jgi:hypothetical protein